MDSRRLWIAILLLALLGLVISTVNSQPQEGYAVMLRGIEASELGVDHPVGLTYSPSGGVFMAVGASSSAASEIVTFDPFENPTGTSLLPARVADPLNAGYVAAGENLLAVNEGGEWLSVQIGPRGLKPSPAADRFPTAALRLGNPQGMAVDEATERLFILDAAGPSLVNVTADLSNLFSDLLAGKARVERIRLTLPTNAPLRGIAFHPGNGHLFIGEAGGTMLYEVTADGHLLQTYDISEMGLIDPQAMVFAPSADATDHPSIMNLYLADSGGRSGQVVEISFVPPPPRVVANQTTATLVNIIDTSKAAWNPSAPDAAGVAYRPSVGRLIISDSEVEEAHPDFQGYNVFQSTVGGTLDQTGLCSTQAFSNEPTGVAVNPGNDHIFFSDDNNNRIYEIDPVDGIYCNGNDTVTQLNTLTFGSDDPEGVSYGINKLFISDGINTEIYIVNLVETESSAATMISRSRASIRNRSASAIPRALSITPTPVRSSWSAPWAVTGFCWNYP